MSRSPTAVFILAFSLMAAACGGGGKGTGASDAHDGAVPFGAAGSSGAQDAGAAGTAGSAGVTGASNDASVDAGAQTSSDAGGGVTPSRRKTSDGWAYFPGYLSEDYAGWPQRGPGLVGMVATSADVIVGWNTVQQLFRSDDTLNLVAHPPPPGFGGPDDAVLGNTWALVAMDGTQVAPQQKVGELFGFNSLTGPMSQLVWSQNDGGTWSVVASLTSVTDVNGLVVRDANTLFVAHGSTLERSDDDGVKFSKVLSDLPSGKLFVDSKDTVYVWTDTQLSRRFPLETSWHQRTLPTVNDFIVLSDGSLLLATASGVQRSADYGDSWTSITGAPANLQSFQLAASGRLYATNITSMFVSGDLGSTWHSIGPHWVTTGSDTTTHPGVGIYTVMTVMADDVVLVEEQDTSTTFLLSPAVQVKTSAGLPAPVARPASCYDGTQNGTETAVDCGGLCGICGM